MMSKKNAFISLCYFTLTWQKINKWKICDVYKSVIFLVGGVLGEKLLVLIIIL